MSKSMMSFVKYLVNVVRLNSPWEAISASHIHIYKEWREQVLSGKYPLDMELPWLTIVAKNYMQHYLRHLNKRDVRIFEYGSGGSSLFFLKHAGMVVSVEHDPTWFEVVRKAVLAKSATGWEGIMVGPEAIPAGVEKGLRKDQPLDYVSEDPNYVQYQWRRYASSIDRFPDNHFDIVLVDGRARPSCLYHSIPKVKRGGLLVLDNAEREYYLSSGVIPKEGFQLICAAQGALICTNQFTKTNIYLRQ
jgi:hypothetical protein